MLPNSLNPDFSLPFIVSAGASDATVGAVLSQVKEFAVAYWSHQLEKAEHNCSTIEKEALATDSKCNQGVLHLSIWASFYFSH